MGKFTRSNNRRLLPRAIDMKIPALIIGIAGLVFVSSRTALANDTTSVTPAVPSVKQDSGHAITVPAAKETAPHRVPPPSPKPNLPIDAGRKRSTANIGGATVAGGHKDG